MTDSRKLDADAQAQELAALAHRYTAKTIDSWRAQRLPVLPLAKLMLAHAVALLAETTGNDVAVAELRQLADGLEKGDAAGPPRVN